MSALAARFHDDTVGRAPPSLLDEQRNLAAFLRVHAVRSPQRVALRFGAEQLTYGELDELGGRLGEVLGRHGVQRGHRVLLLVPVSPLLYPVLFGVMSIGACAVVVDGLADLVIGPSDDGGFWLVGGRTTLPQSSWTAPRYSTGCARADFLAALPDGLHVHHLPQLRDLDEADDLAAVASALRALPAPTPAQLRALHRLDLLCATIGR